MTPALMKKQSVLIITALALIPLAASNAEAPSLALEKAIPLPGVKGRIDHFALDAKGRRLFMAALGNDTVEFLDPEAGQRARSVTGCHKPQGVLFLPASQRLCIANGGDGTVSFHDAASGALIKKLDGMDDADNVRFDSKAQTVYVGYGDGALAIISAASFTRTGTIKLAGHPESFQLEKNGPRIFVNVPDSGHVAVVDRDKRAVIATWPLTGFKANFPMALDEANHRLFIGCRKPARLVVLDTRDGGHVSDLAISGDTDDLFYDAARQRIYLSCGEGYLDVLQQKSADTYQLRDRITTSSGARTCFYDSASDELFLAVPARGNKSAEVRVYRAAP